MVCVLAACRGGDTERDSAPAPHEVVCAPTAGAITVASTGRDQVTPAMSGDDSGAWIVWSEQLDGYWSAQAAWVDCSGAVVHGPVQVSEGERSAIEVGVVVDDDGGALVVWQQEETGGSTLHSRRLSPAAELVGPTTPIAPFRAEGVPTGRWQSPDAVALPDGGFAVTGTWEHGDADGFQVFVAWLDAEGAVDGEAIDVDLQPDIVQRRPALTVLDGSRLAVSWLAETTGGAEAMWAEITGRQPTLVAFIEGDSGVPAVSGRWLTYHVPAGVRVTDPLAGVSFLVNDATLIEHTPAVVATTDGGGALAWYSLAGTVSDLRLGALSAEGAVSRTTVLDAETSASSGFDVVAMADERFAVAWQDGVGGDAVVRMQIVSLADQ